MATDNYEYLNNIFGTGRTYKVPPFQRSYSWDEEQWDEFWEDILGLLSEKDDHYMGPLVLQPERPGDKRNFLVIDGQQRLATFSIIILAVISRLSAIGKGEASAGGRVSDRQNKQRKEAENRIKLLKEQYIGSQDIITLKYRTKLILNKEDDLFYSETLVPLKPESLRFPEAPSEKLLNKALKWFEKKLEEQYKNSKDSGEELGKFVETIMDKLTFTVVSVVNAEEAFMVFETLNARGVQLAPTDLLKNYLFSVASKTNNQMDAKDHLKKMEEKWGTMINTLDKENVIDFIRAYWYSCHELGQGGRGINLFKIISREVKDKESAFALVKKLNENANIYVALRDPNHSNWKDSDEQKDLKKHLEELKIFGNIKRPFPLLLALYRKYMDKDREQFIKFLEYVTVITFRYNVICQLATREQETIYNKAALAIHKGDSSEAKTHLKTLYEKVGDKTFKQLFSEKELKRNQQIRYILRKLENDARSGKSDGEAPDMTIDIDIEYILPKNSNDHADWDDEFNLKNDIHRLGNLTPLTKEELKRVDNRSYDAKRPTYKKSSYILTSSIGKDYSEWNVETIENRQRRMADRAAKIWCINL